MSGARPYVPLLTKSTEPFPNGPKPWMRVLDGETQSEAISRCLHSCYRCGHQEADMDALNEHEDHCRAE